MPLVDRVGLGGGGSLYDPQVSGWNSDLVFVACDMTGLYRSIDGGGHWTMLDTRIVQGSNRLSVAFHPVQQRILAYHPFQGVKESTDGLIWNDFSPSTPLNAQAYPSLVQTSPGCPPPGTPNQNNNRGLVVTALSYSPDKNGRILAGTECGIFLYNEQTRQWQWVYPLNATGNPARYPTYDLGVAFANAAEVISFIALPNPHAAGQWVYFCATSCFILRSDDSGLTWTDISNNLPTRPLGVFYPGLPSDTLTTQTVDPNYKPSRIRGFAGGHGPATSVGGTGDHLILYATVATTLTGSTVDGGVYYYDSLDDPSGQPNLTPNWRGVMGNGINFSPVGTTPIGPPTFSDDRNGLVIPRYERLAVSRNNPHTLYVSAINTLYHYPTIYRGTYTRPGNQGSVTWTGAYQGFQNDTTPLQPDPTKPIVPGTMGTNLQGGWIEDDLGWGFGGSANGLTAAPNSSDRVFLANTAAVHMTDNGTANPPNWVSRYTDQVPDNTGTGAPWWRTTGLDITSTWHYYVSPANRHYIANTDIGLSQSIDGGDTWRSFHPGCTAPMPPPWSQCSLGWSEFYELAFEGANIWAAVSMQHDLPYDLDHFKPGAVLFSTNNGDSWQELTSTGLPQIPVGMPPVMITPPVTSIVRVPGTIYVALWRRVLAPNGGGVFALNDGATSWSEVKVAAPAAGHRAALTGLATYRLQLSGSTLYCVVSDGSADAGLYSCNPNPGSNQGWQPIGMVGQYRVIDFALNTDGTTVNQYLCIDNLGVHNAPAVYKLVTPQIGVSTWTDLTVPFSTANTLHGDKVVVFALSFIGDMVYASSITHGIWCAQLKEVNAYTGSGSISWVQYRALPFTNAQRITELGDPASGSSTLIITSFGGGVARVQRNFYFVVDRGEFTQGEVDAVAGAGNLAPYPSALYAVLDGFLPIELMGARTAADLLANFKVQVTTPGTAVGVALNSIGPQILLEDPSLPAERFQRVAFQLTISIDKFQAFVAGAPQSIDISATFGRYTCTATIRLTAQPVPFMQDGPTPWLSLDIAAFQVALGDTVFGQTLTALTSPRAFIQAILTQLRTNPPGWPTEFDTLRDGPKSVLQLSQYVPGTNPAVPTYNFALARVHNADPATKATAFNVFFRLFNTAWTGFEYDPNQAYRTATSGPAPIAVLGVKTGLGEGGALVSVPCFAADRVPPSAMLSTQQDPYNLASAANGNEINPGSVQVYGCWLDFNQPTLLFPQYPGTQDGQFTGTLLSIQELIRGRHQCLVVEIYRTGDSITTGATPGTSDRLSQRNLFIVGCDNPGPPPAHMVQHSFEIMAPLHRERSRLARGEAEGERRFMDTDELVFMGADLPDGARAQLFFPTVNVEDLLAAQGGQLRAKAYRRVDDHTIEFDPSEMSYLSLPPGHVGNLPGLLSIQLPEGVRRDQEFRYRVQQWSDHRVLGQFELRIPVAVPRDLLLEEENKLAVLRYIQLATPAGDAWRDVLDRYVEQVADRVRGLGGDPDSIEPSGAGVGAPGQGLKGCLARLIRIVSEHPLAFLIGGVALVLLLAWLRDLRRRIARG